MAIQKNGELQFHLRLSEAEHKAFLRTFEPRRAKYPRLKMSQHIRDLIMAAAGEAPGFAGAMAPAAPVSKRK